MRRNTKRETARADAAEKRADAEKKRADKAEKKHEHGIDVFVSSLREFVPNRAEVKRRLMEDLVLDEQTAEEKLGDKWP